MVACSCGKYRDGGELLDPRVPSLNETVAEYVSATHMGEAIVDASASCTRIPDPAISRVVLPATIRHSAWRASFMSIIAGAAGAAPCLRGMAPRMKCARQRCQRVVGMLFIVAIEAFWNHL